MKLKNKLIPLIGTTVIAASTIAPLVTLTSCKSEVALTTYDYLNGKREDFLPTEEPVSATYNTQNATTNYILKHKAGKNLFVEDMVWCGWLKYVANKAYYELNYPETTITKASLSLSTPTFNTINVSFPGGYSGEQYATVSFTIVVNTELTSVWTDSKGQEQHEVETIEKKIVYTNVPFVCYYDNDELMELVSNDYGDWKVGFGGAFMEHLAWCFGYMNEPWSINGYENSVTTRWIAGDEKSQSITTKSTPYKASSYKEMYELYEDGRLNEISFDFPSSYLSGVEQDGTEIVCPEGAVYLHAKSPWNDDDTANPTIELTGLRFKNMSKDITAGDWTLELPGGAETFEGSVLRTTNSKYKDYKLQIKNGAKVVVDDDGYISIEAQVISGKAEGEVAFDQTAVTNEKWDFGLLTFNMLRNFVISSPDGKKYEVKPDFKNTGVGLWINGTAKLYSVEATNPMQHTSGESTAYWDGQIDIKFTYDAIVPTAALEVGQFNAGEIYITGQSSSLYGEGVEEYSWENDTATVDYVSSIGGVSLYNVHLSPDDGAFYEIPCNDTARTAYIDFPKAKETFGEDYQKHHFYLFDKYYQTYSTISLTGDHVIELTVPAK